METIEFRLFPNPELDPDFRRRIEVTIKTPGLNSPAWCATRWDHFEWFEEHGRLHEVEREFPFVAREIRRLGPESVPSINQGVR